MPSVALQCEAIPPGLESGSGCRPLQPAGVAPVRSSSEQVLKEDLINEVTTAVREHIDWKTASAVEVLWQKGQKAMQYMQQQHQAQTEKLQSQLLACTESYRHLERENTVLRTNLEALMKHITLLVGPPTPVAQSPISLGPFSHGPSPFFPPWMNQSAVPKAAASESQETADSPREEDLLPAPLPETPKHETTAATAAAASSAGTERTLSVESDNSEKPTQASGSSEKPRQDWVTISRPKETKQAMSTFPTFTLTLRRADSVPLGLDVTGETGGECLTVQAVRPGGAVEAWNRQCPGEMREIRAGDRIICINDMEDANAMREECVTKHLLKMTVVRPIPAAVMPSAATAAQMYAMGPLGFLRADAHEFVPHVPAAC